MLSLSWIHTWGEQESWDISPDLFDDSDEEEEEKVPQVPNEIQVQGELAGEEELEDEERNIDFQCWWILLFELSWECSV